MTVGCTAGQEAVEHLGRDSQAHVGAAVVPVEQLGHLAGVGVGGAGEAFPSKFESAGADGGPRLVAFDQDGQRAEADGPGEPGAEARAQLLERLALDEAALGLGHLGQVEPVEDLGGDVAPLGLAVGQARRGPGGELVEQQVLVPLAPGLAAGEALGEAGDGLLHVVRVLVVAGVGEIADHIRGVGIEQHAPDAKAAL